VPRPSRRSGAGASSGWPPHALRIFGQFGLSEGLAGHLTARDPERSDCFWVNHYGMNFSMIKVGPDPRESRG
jgi:hypothetical protein